MYFRVRVLVCLGCEVGSERRPRSSAQEAVSGLEGVVGGLGNDVCGAELRAPSKE